jgi:hypothetical protein
VDKIISPQSGELMSTCELPRHQLCKICSSTWVHLHFSLWLCLHSYSEMTRKAFLFLAKPRERARIKAVRRSQAIGRPKSPINSDWETFISFFVFFENWNGPTAALKGERNSLFYLCYFILLYISLYHRQHSIMVQTKLWRWRWPWPWVVVTALSSSTTHQMAVYLNCVD